MHTLYDSSRRRSGKHCFIAYASPRPPGRGEKARRPREKSFTFLLFFFFFFFLPKLQAPKLELTLHSHISSSRRRSSALPTQYDTVTHTFTHVSLMLRPGGLVTR
jgi:hypothetical protein